MDLDNVRFPIRQPRDLIKFVKESKPDTQPNTNLSIFDVLAEVLLFDAKRGRIQNDQKSRILLEKVAFWFISKSKK